MARALTWSCCRWCLTEDEKTAARIDQEINKILLSLFWWFISTSPVCGALPSASDQSTD